MRLLREKDSLTQGKKICCGQCVFYCRLDRPSHNGPLVIFPRHDTDSLLLQKCYSSVSCTCRCHHVIDRRLDGQGDVCKREGGSGGRPTGFHIAGRSHSIKISVPIGSPLWRPPTPQLFA